MTPAIGDRVKVGPRGRAVWTVDDVFPNGRVVLSRQNPRRIGRVYRFDVWVGDDLRLVWAAFPST